MHSFVFFNYTKSSLVIIIQHFININGKNIIISQIPSALLHLDYYGKKSGKTT